MSLRTSLLLGTLVAVVASGCGSMMRSMQKGERRPAPPLASVTKQARVGSRLAVLDVPPLRVGEEALLTLSVSEASTALPETDLIVTFHCRNMSEAQHAAMPKFATVVRPGVYAVVHTFEDAGPADIVATIAATVDSPPMSVRVNGDVHSPAAVGDVWLTRTRTFLGAGAMALMMALRFAVL